MAIWQDIPQPLDNRNQSQADLLNNARYLYNITTTPQTGVLPVDHQITGDSTSTTDGFHKQVSFLDVGAQPTDLVNTVNGQSSDAILYTFPDSDGESQLHFYNGTVDTIVGGTIASGTVNLTNVGFTTVFTLPDNCFGFINLSSTALNVRAHATFNVVSNVLYIAGHPVTVSQSSSISNVFFQASGLSIQAQDATAPPLTFNYRLTYWML